VNDVGFPAGSINVVPGVGEVAGSVLVALNEFSQIKTVMQNHG